MNTQYLRLIAAGALVAAVMTPAHAQRLTVDELCGRRLDRMLAAQSSRLIEELKKCSQRTGDADEFVASCLPFLGDDTNLHASEARLDAALKRVERHGDDKFPRKCKGVQPDFFEPACSSVVDAEKQLRRCVYNDHTFDALLDLVEIARELPSACRTHTLHLAKMAWRDWILDDDDSALQKGPKRLKRHCGNATSHWSLVSDVITARSLPLRQIVPED